MPTTLLIDNGSSRPESTLALRRLSVALGERLGTEVQPVSLLHSDKVSAAALGGRPAETLDPFLRRRLAAGKREFLAIPLFFGPSRALSRFIPETAVGLAPDLGPCHVQVAPPLCPLPEGEPRLADILADHVEGTARARAIRVQRVVLVDHGSPIPQVTAVRQWLAARLRERLGPEVELREAVMERRPGAEFDFNGPLLADVLEGLAGSDPGDPVILAMLFLAPGRHAGPGGDIAQICAALEQAHPGFRVHPTALVGEHPGLIPILTDRASQTARDCAAGSAASRGTGESDRHDPRREAASAPGQRGQG